MLRWVEDSWTSKFRTSDKFYHFFGCALIFATLRITGLTGWLCFVLTFLAGFLVELIDAVRADGFSWRDMVADILGGSAMWLWVSIWGK